MAERYVPCTCPACKGSLVTIYTRRKHSKLYSDIDGAKRKREETNKESTCLFTHAQLTTIDEATQETRDTINYVVHDETESPREPSSPDGSYTVEDGQVFI